MRQFRTININETDPKNYASFGIALMVMRMHNWECTSIINGKLKFTRLASEKIVQKDGSDDYYNFGEPSGELN